ncbi:MAG: glycine cleavage system aminomethyltransferase GcvT [Elusimicrobiales bacterium]|jgi:aminomethyltransferase|nr:glycine cleavage system aminomethyltransferase GcvT [Elusimicrobiales bacterium]NLH39460.1 glycine cleavage system aminomethyltransferase GcvT [Elusimicrobiota bacterium]
MALNNTTVKRTHLNDVERKYGGKMVDFHGWELPVQFEGIIKEHLTVRNGVGLFDVSHMGQVFVDGPDARKFLDYVNANNVAKLKKGEGVYSHLPNGRGGIVDDVINFCLDEERFLVIVNATTTEKDYNWLLSNSKGFNVKISNKSSDFSMIAIQGPKSVEVMKKFAPEILRYPRFGIVETDIYGKHSYISRTGYTGEDGFEITAPNDIIVRIWEELMNLGKEYDIKPCGLGARDSLRLESGYLLYGSDIDDEHSSYEANYGWVVKLKKGNFIGKELYEKEKAEGIKRKLTGIVMEKGILRPGYKVFKDGKEIGVLTSATYSPSLNKSIAEGYMPPNLNIGDEVEVEIRDKRLPAKVSEVPFYKGGVFFFKLEN